MFIFPFKIEKSRFHEKMVILDKFFTQRINFLRNRAYPHFYQIFFTFFLLYMVIFPEKSFCKNDEDKKFTQRIIA